jgi:hypothetical protein
MPGVTRAHPPVANIIGEHRFVGKDITMLMVDFNVDADGSFIAMNSALNAISRYGNILIAGAVYGTGQQIDVIIEGTNGGSDYVSEDGTVTGTLEQALEEDLINLGTIDGVNFATGTPAVTTKTAFKLA